MCMHTLIIYSLFEPRSAVSVCLEMYAYTEYLEPISVEVVSVCLQI